MPDFVWNDGDLPETKVSSGVSNLPHNASLDYLEVNQMTGALASLRNAFLGTVFYAKDYGVDFGGDVSKAAANIAGLDAAAAAAKTVAGTVFLHPGIIPIPNASTWVVDGCHVVGAGGCADWGGANADFQGGSPATLIKHAVQDGTGNVPVVSLSMPHPQADPEAEARGYHFQGVGIGGSFTKAAWLAMPEPVPGTANTYGSITGEHGLVIDNSRAFIKDVSVSGVTGHGVVVRDCSGSVVESLLVTGCFGDGIHFDDNNVFGTPNSSPNDRAISLSTFVNCLFTGCGRDGIRMFSGPSTLTFINCDCENVQGYGIRLIGSSYRAAHENSFQGMWSERVGINVRFETGSGTDRPSTSLIGSAPSGGAYMNDVEIPHCNGPASAIDTGWANGDVRPGGFLNTYRGESNGSENGTNVFPTERRARINRVYGVALPRLVLTHTGAVNLDTLPLAGGIAEISLTGDTTYTFNTPYDGQCFIFAFTNAGASHNYTVTWDPRMDWLGSAPVIRTGSGVRSIVSFYYDLDADLFRELYRTPSSI